MEKEVKVIVHGSGLKNIEDLGFVFIQYCGYVKWCSSWDEAHEVGEKIESEKRFSSSVRRRRGDWDSFETYQVETDELEIYFD